MITHLKPDIVSLSADDRVIEAEEWDSPQSPESLKTSPRLVFRPVCRISESFS